MLIFPLNNVVSTSFEGRSDLCNSGGRWSKGGGGGKGYFQNSGGSWLKGGVKKFRGVWTLDEAMVSTDFECLCKFRVHLTVRRTLNWP